MRRDLTGKKFNDLTALSFSYRNKHGQAIWLCECVCGNKTEVCMTKLQNGHTKSCGCRCSRVKNHNRKNFPGQRLGRLTVVDASITKTINGRKYGFCECKCDCGNTKEIKAQLLNRSKWPIKSCGCLSKWRSYRTHSQIYCIKNKKGDVVYIGQTTLNDVEERLDKHLEDSKYRMREWLDSISYRPEIKFMFRNVPIKLIDDLEGNLIKDFCINQPLLNTIHNSQDKNWYKDLLHDY